MGGRVEKNEKTDFEEIIGELSCGMHEDVKNKEVRARGRRDKQFSGEREK